MAGARSSARRQLVAKGRGRRRAASPAVDPAVVRRAVRWAISAAVSLVLLAVVLPWVVTVARGHAYFAVREVAVRHRGQLEPEALRTLAGVDVGMSVWDVDAEVVETRLLTNGWIRSALVRRELPDRVVIHVREHRPVAILAVEDESPGLYYLAANGRIFAPVMAGDARDLPFVTGLGREDLGGDDAFGPRAVRRALALLRQASRRPAVGAVSELHVDRDDGLTLMPTHPAVPITIGWGDYGVKLGRVAEVLPLWAGREGEIRGVICIFDDDVVVRMRARVPAKPDGARAPREKKPGAKTTTTKKKGAGRTPAVGA
jgi:cell division protein FtsQ